MNSRFIPHIAKLLLNLKEINLFDFIKESKTFYTLPNLQALAKIGEIMHFKVEKISKSVERIEILLFDMKSRNEKKHKLEPKRVLLWSP